MSAPLTAIDLGLVEEGIEIGKKIMAEVIAAYPNAGKGAAAARGRARLQRATATRMSTRLRKPKARILRTPKSKAQVVPAVGSGYLNEVSSLTVPQQARRANREH